MDTIDEDICLAIARLSGLPLAIVRAYYAAGKTAPYTQRQAVFNP